jgi:hypothetical protein
MKLLLFSLFSFLIFGLTTKAQSITDKDFRLLIDGKLYSDSTNIISVTDLLKLQKVTGNFSWITVKSIVVYCDFVKQEDRNHVYDGVGEILCAGNVICKDAKDLIKKMKPGHTVIISADEAVNKQGARVHVKDIVFRIK